MHLGDSHNRKIWIYIEVRRGFQQLDLDNECIELCACRICHHDDHIIAKAAITMVS